jgi:hypothetical protein
MSERKRILLIDLSFSREGQASMPSLYSAQLVAACREKEILTTLIDLPAEMGSLIIRQGISETSAVIRKNREIIKKLPEDYSARRFLKNLMQKRTLLSYFTAEMLHTELVIEKKMTALLDPEKWRAYNFIYSSVLSVYYDAHDLFPRRTCIETYIEHRLRREKNMLTAVCCIVTNDDSYTKRILKRIRITAGCPVIGVLYPGQGLSTFIREECIRRVEQLIKEQAVDYGILGEPDHILPALILRTSKNLLQIRNHVVGLGEREKLSAAVVTNLDTVPVPDFSGHTLGLYLSPTRVLPIETTRGCYWRRCQFCSLFAVHGQEYHTYSIERVMHVLRWYRQHYDCTHVEFLDNVISPERIQKIARAIRKQQNPITFTYQSRFEQSYSKALFRNLAQAGCVQILWGLESAVESILRACDKGTTLEQIKKNLKDSAQAGIANMCYILFGLPGETNLTIQETLRFLKKIRSSVAMVKIQRLSLEPQTQTILTTKPSIEYPQKLTSPQLYRIISNIVRDIAFEKIIVSSRKTPLFMFAFEENGMVHVLNDKSLVIDWRTMRKQKDLTCYPVIVNGSGNAHLPLPNAWAHKSNLKVIDRKLSQKEQVKDLVDFIRVCDGRHSLEEIREQLLPKGWSLSKIYKYIGILFRQKKIFLFSSRYPEKVMIVPKREINKNLVTFYGETSGLSREE